VINPSTKFFEATLRDVLEAFTDNVEEEFQGNDLQKNAVKRFSDPLI
jgi:hypothetical protein